MPDRPNLIPLGLDQGPLAPPDYPNTPEAWLHLAGSYVLTSDRLRALLTLSFALYYTGSHPSVVAMMENLGLRRVPVLPVLDRNHFANILLGKVRHRLMGPKRIR